MRTGRLLECLDDDFRRLRDLAGGDPTVMVPTCPEWSLADLVEHVAMVYLHKVETMRRGKFPKPWPPQHKPEAPGSFLARAYAALSEEFARRDADDPAVTWFEPDQTVGFWIRRMAHETAIHRVDAELAAGAQHRPIPEDLAVDGVDEFLNVCLAYGSLAYHDEFAEPLASFDGDGVVVKAGGAAWLVMLSRDAITTTQLRSGDGAATDEGAAAVATLNADPATVVQWLWRRVGEHSVTIEGDPAVAAKLYEILGIAAQ